MRAGQYWGASFQAANSPTNSTLAQSLCAVCVRCAQPLPAFMHHGQLLSSSQKQAKKHSRKKKEMRCTVPSEWLCSPRSRYASPTKASQGSWQTLAQPAFWVTRWRRSHTAGCNVAAAPTRPVPCGQSAHPCKSCRALSPPLRAADGAAAKEARACVKHPVRLAARRGRPQRGCTTRGRQAACSCRTRRAYASFLEPRAPPTRTWAVAVGELGVFLVQRFM